MKHINGTTENFGAGNTDYFTKSIFFLNTLKLGVNSECCIIRFRWRWSKLWCQDVLINRLGSKCDFLLTCVF